MNCMKCGNIIAADQVFCEDCLAGMEKYPVAPETPVALPPRDETATPKRSSTRRIRKPEEQIAKLKTLAMVLFVLLAAVSIALAMITSTLIQVLNVPKDLPNPDQSTSQNAD